MGPRRVSQAYPDRREEREGGGDETTSDSCSGTGGAHEVPSMAIVTLSSQYATEELRLQYTRNAGFTLTRRVQGRPDDHRRKLMITRRRSRPAAGHRPDRLVR